MRLLIYLLITVLLYGCQSGNNKEKYFYLDDFDSMDTGYPYGTVVYKAKKRGGFDTIIVSSDIVKYGENKSYIIALQRPNEELAISEIKNRLELFYTGYKKYNYTNENFGYPRGTNKDILLKSLDSLVSITKDSTEAYQIEAEKIFKKEPFYQKIFQNELNYYIIDKKADSVFGPLKYDEFERLKQKKNINVKFGDVLFWNW